MYFCLLCDGAFSRITEFYVNTVEKPSQQSRMVGWQILNNQAGLQGNKYDVMLTVATMSIKGQIKILQNRRTVDYSYISRLLSHSSKREKRVRGGNTFSLQWVCCNVLFVELSFSICSIFRVENLHVVSYSELFAFVIVLFLNTATDGGLLHSYFITIPVVFQ